MLRNLKFFYPYLKIFSCHPVESPKKLFDAPLIVGILATMVASSVGWLFIGYKIGLNDGALQEKSRQKQKRLEAEHKSERKDLPKD